jgi:hypothetical protein
MTPEESLKLGPNVPGLVSRSLHTFARLFFCSKLLLFSSASSVYQRNRPPKFLRHSQFGRGRFLRSWTNDFKCLPRSSAEEVAFCQIVGPPRPRLRPISAPVTLSLRPLAGPIRTPSPWLMFSLCLSSCFCLPYANTAAMKSFQAMQRSSAALFLKDVVCCNRLCHSSASRF